MDLPASFAVSVLHELLSVQALGDLPAHETTRRERLYSVAPVKCPSRVQKRPLGTAPILVFPVPPPFPARIRHRPGCVGRDRATVLVSPPSVIHRSDSFQSRPHSRFAPGSSVVHLASMGAVWADVQCERVLFAYRSPRLTPLLRWRDPLGVPFSLRACNARDAQSQPELPEATSRYQRPSRFWALRIWRRICRPAGQETFLPPPSTPGPAIHPHVHLCTLS